MFYRYIIKSGGARMEGQSILLNQNIIQSIKP